MWRACADMARCVVGADVPGGPRARGRPRCRSVDVPWATARRGRRALPWGCGVERGRGRRPRRPARPWVSPMSSRGRPVGNGAPRTSRPTRCAHGVRVRRAVCVCGRGAERGRGRRLRRPARPWVSPMSSRGRSVGAARRGRRALPGARMACVCGARCACADMARSVVGADVPGGPRARGRPRCRPVGNGAPRTSRPTRCAHGVRVRTWRACAARAVRVRMWRGAW